MAGPEQVVAKLEDALATAASSASEPTAQHYEALAQELADLGEMARRFCEAHADYRTLVRKLRAGDALTPDELSTLRLLIVGDADYYLKYDEEFDRCKAEIGKIIGEIARLKDGELGVDALMHLNVLCREADSLLALTQHYLEARDRVRRFEGAIGGTLDRDSARTLAAIVERMVAESQ